MASTTVRADSASHKPNCELSLEDLPEVYSSNCVGNCLQPVFSDGARLVFSTTDAAKAGDFVAVWLDPGAGEGCDLPRYVKRLAGQDGREQVVILEQINPPRRYRVPTSKILAMHKVIGEAEMTGDGVARMTRQWIGGQMMSYHPE